MDGVSLREFARLDGCSEGLVRKGIKRGQLKPLANGRLNPQLAGSTWRLGNVAGASLPQPTLPPRGRDKAPAQEQPPPPRNGKARSAAAQEAIRVAALAMDVTPPASALPVTERDDFDPNDPRQLALGLAGLFEHKFEADKFAAAYRGALSKIEFDLKSGKVVEIDEVAAQVAGQFRAVRTRLLSIGATVGPLVAAQKNPALCKELIDREITAALEELTADADDGAASTSAGGRSQLPRRSDRTRRGPRKGKTGRTKAAAPAEPV
jgi:hypothetical protein